MQYRGWNPDKAVEDYFVRINDHEKHYQPVEETTWPFIRIINVSVFLHVFTNSRLPNAQVGEKIMVNVRVGPYSRFAVSLSSLLSSENSRLSTSQSLAISVLYS